MKPTPAQQAALKKEQLDILVNIIAICKQLNLRYYLLGGTLIGAIRHKGFIPWDDDIDVAMFRYDFNKFMEIAPAELPDLYVEYYDSYTPEEKRYRILNATRPEKLSEEQKRMFTYFSKVPGMDDQILEAIKNVYDHADEKTSRRGNIAIMGGHGTGKTQLTENLVKAICRELGLEAIKYANLDASDMNQKEPATVIGKMAGGFLLIQRASYMTKETVEKLSQAMDFRTFHGPYCNRYPSEFYQNQE